MREGQRVVFIGYEGLCQNDGVIQDIIRDKGEIIAVFVQADYDGSLHRARAVYTKSGTRVWSLS